MFDRLRDALEAAPERLAKRPVLLARRARHQAHLLRGESQERLYALQTGALERVEDLLEKAPVPGRDKVVELVHARLEAATRPPEGWEDLNAKDAIARVGDMGRIELIRARRHEQANKARKTVLAALDKAIDALDAPPPELVAAAS